jgi:hypothetical protein
VAKPSREMDKLWIRVSDIPRSSVGIALLNSVLETDQGNPSARRQLGVVLQA